MWFYVSTKNCEAPPVVVRAGCGNPQNDLPRPVPVPNPTPTARVYRVQSGDSLSRIATKFDTTIKRLLELNPDLTVSTTLRVGQRIYVP